VGRADFSALTNTAMADVIRIDLFLAYYLVNGGFRLLMLN